MLDPNLLRDHPEQVRDGLRNRGLDPDKALAGSRPSTTYGVSSFAKSRS